MNYLSYNNTMYLNDLQAMRERLDNQIRQAQANSQVIPNITQNFQLQPTLSNELDGKYAKDIEEVKNTLAIKKTLFIDNESKNLWIKESDGTIKTYELNEVIELDEKDKKIIELEKEIENLKGEKNNVKSSGNNVDESTTSKKPSKFQSTKSTN